ncbi:helix-turn-helix transcriptional regulator [Hyphococcus sp.]|uniref:helix-turn-helix transcriptional regulator n=1 Tax=Hyphococcus sp. TaxID=2038636 RepID=UPI0035C7830A
MAESPKTQLITPPPLEEIARSNPGWFDEAVNAAEAAKMTGVPPATLATWRSRGGGPRFLKLGRVVRYRRRALLEWMAARERRHTGDTGTR